jgi:hypothetical protein
LAAVLAAVDRDRLKGYDRIDLLQARARQVAHDQAEMYADMLAVAEAVGEELSSEGCDLAEIEDSAASEIRACLVVPGVLLNLNLGWPGTSVSDSPRFGRLSMLG